MKNVLGCILFLFGVVTVGRAAVNASVGCNVLNWALQNNASSGALSAPSVNCSVTNPNGLFASASAEGSLSTSGGELSGSTSASGTRAQPTEVAAATISGMATFYTLGPVRTGTLVFNITSFDDSPFDPGPQITIGSLSASCTALAALTSCAGSLLPNSQNPPNYSALSGTVPFTIGQAFTVEEQYSASGIQHSELAFTYALFDANGNPVQVFAAPEPASYLITGLGIAFLGLRCRMRYGSRAKR